jgi:hypothetical protein
MLSDLPDELKVAAEQIEERQADDERLRTAKALKQQVNAKNAAKAAAKK